MNKPIVIQNPQELLEYYQNPHYNLYYQLPESDTLEVLVDFSEEDILQGWENGIEFVAIAGKERKFA